MGDLFELQTFFGLSITQATLHFSLIITNNIGPLLVFFQA